MMTIQDIIKASGTLPDSIRGEVNADFDTKPFRGGGYYSCMWLIKRLDDGSYCRAHMKFISYGNTPEESTEKLKKLILEDERRSTQRVN
jgi:hypothetical protein